MKKWLRFALKFLLIIAALLVAGIFVINLIFLIYAPSFEAYPTPEQIEKSRISHGLFCIVSAVLETLIIMGFFKLKNHNFPFDDAPNTPCFTCCHVLNDSKPILYVSHDEDGKWQFLCGQKHTAEEARIVSLKEITVIDKTVGNLAVLNCGESAEKDSANGKWVLHEKK